MHVLQRAALLVAVVLSTGCGPDGPDEVIYTKNLQDVRADLGGMVSYVYDFSEGLEGVAIVVTDKDGIQTTTATTADGIWFIADMQPGTYDISYSLAGYITRESFFIIEAGGENDVGNIYINVGSVGLLETGIVATISGALTGTLEDFEILTDGAGGISAALSLGPEPTLW